MPSYLQQILGGLGGAFGGGGSPFTPGAQYPNQGPPGVGAAIGPAAAVPAAPGFGERLAAGLNNPATAGLLGVGGSLLAAADRGDDLGGALRSGIFGGAGAFAGASQQRANRQAEEEERRKLLEAITRGYGGLAGGGGSGLGPLPLYQALFGNKPGSSSLFGG